MRTYVIFDQMGMKHGTVKATSTHEAMNVFCGKCSQSFRDMVFAIDAATMDHFISNLQNIGTMRFIEITNLERDLFNPTKITFVGRENRMFVSERLFLTIVGSNMDNRFILFEDELPEVQEHYMDTYNTFYSL